ncbi:MAG: glycoside hydrolase family 130 protein [Sedimentisphaerales bacterium]
MPDIAKRLKKNPILVPATVRPSHTGLKVECLLNPGAFEYNDRIWLLMRVAERPEQKEGKISFPVMDNGEIRILEFDKATPNLNCSDQRVIIHKGHGYLTTLSHLRLAHSTDGNNFTVVDENPLFGQGCLESYGIEDCRVAKIEGKYYLTYTAVSNYGYGVGLMSTSDWTNFNRYGMIISGPNKDCALFEGKINGRYYCLHRPNMSVVGGNYIWLAESNDLRYWGGHKCVATTREGMWDSERIGAGASPIKTNKGWLEIYHGADKNHRYCLGALLLDTDNPSKVIARSDEPIMEPITDYEKNGFFGNVIFTNGHIVKGDTIMMYYGASDNVICKAELSINEILDSLKI